MITGREATENKITLEPNEPVHYPGFIAPSGEFYYCPPGGHYRLACILNEQFYTRRIKKPELVLEDKNWLKVDRTGGIFTHNISEVTQAQMDTLDALLVCSHTPEQPQMIMGIPEDQWNMRCSPKGMWKHEIRTAIYFLEGKVK